MTAPFSFPTINPGQPIMEPGMGDTISSGIAGVIKAMQDRQKLDQEKQEFESKQQYFKTLDEGNALDNQQKRDKMKQEQKTLDAKGIANDAFAQWAGSGGDFTKVGQIIASGKFKNNPDAAQTFIATVHDHLTNLQQAAQAQKAESEAAVASATQGDEIGKAHSTAETAANQATITGAQAAEAPAQEHARTRLYNAQAAKAIADAKQPPESADPSARINSAINMWKTGAVTLGAAFKQAGQPLPDGADPNEKFDPSSQGRSMAVFKAQAKSAAAQSLIAGSQVDDLLNQGVKISKFTPLKEGVPFGLGHGMVPENEQALLSAGGQYVSQFVLAVSGKAATDKEREFIMKQIIPMANDKPLVQKQKSLMREAFNQVAYDASQGANRPMSEIINDVIGAAKAKGAEPGMIKFLQSSQMKAMEMERARMKTVDSLSQPPLVADTVPATPDSLSALLQMRGR